MPVQLSSETLIASGLLTPEQLQAAQAEAQKKHRPLEQVLVDLHFVSKEGVFSAVADQLGVPFLDLETYLPDPAVVPLVPEDLARRYQAFPLFRLRTALIVAMADPTDVRAIDQLGAHCEETIEPVLASSNDVARAIERGYGGSGETQRFMESIKLETLEAARVGTSALTEESPISKLVHLIVAQAARDRASDIHIEPEEEHLRIRFRIDGLLLEIPSPPKHLELAIISRVKVLAGMDIAESRVPQDGHFQFEQDGRRVDLRVSTLPTLHGENVVLRLLDSSGVLLSLDKLGFSPATLKQYEAMILRPYGMVLSTGPTGSGKTTTLYSALTRINSVDRNIITIEDPIEYRIGSIRQVQVNPRAGITFANGLRSILRQDPDVIMVGEIRDLETAIIAVQSALTGHLVFSTLHTNDAASAVSRLVNMGVETFLISASVTGIMAQRLLRVICKDCKESYQPSQALVARLGLGERKKVTFYRGKGCPGCKGTGYRGRLGIYELMALDDELREMIIAGASTVALREKARAKGMKLLREDGIEKVQAGLTTIEEISRITEERVEVKPGAAAAKPLIISRPPSPPAPVPPAPVKTAEIEEYQKKIANWLAKK